MLSTGLGVLLKTVQFKAVFPRESLAQSGYRSLPWPPIPFLLWGIALPALMASVLGPIATAVSLLL